MLQKIVTGGQTGVDRAALDAAMLLGIEYGGWCPKGRLDEKGGIPGKYKELKEVLSEFANSKENYDTRTKMNIKDSDATLVLVPSMPLPKEIQDGTILTINDAKKQNKPYLIIDLSKLIQSNVDLIVDWVKENGIGILNVGGPRESTCPGIYQSSLKLLEVALPQCQYSLRNRF